MSSLAGSRASAGVSRRSVLKGATALGTAALVTPCGTPLKAQPKRGGTLRVGMARGSTTDAMDHSRSERASIFIPGTGLSRRT